ncbi:MAG: tripartite tricarboxylate transporter TctB family protein [Rhodospirillales bacterium]|nr:tripartite tricarboxylate transporter TctB family protein [Rhodospirillales bacterium]
MSQSTHVSRQGGPSHRGAEIGTAIAMIVFGLVVIGGSLSVGIGWAIEGPQAGFFPFWVAIVIIVASVLNIAKAYASRDGKLFSEWGQLRQVGKVLAPTTVYVFAVPWLGIYLASALLVAGFMRWIGRYSWAMVAIISIALPIVAYITFEKWFLVPLPKGPIEDMLGL